VAELTGIVADVSRFMALFAIWGILAIALNLQLGQTGLFNAGIIGFWGIGAYAAAMVVTEPLAPGLGTPGHWGIDQSLFPQLQGMSTAFGVGVFPETAGVSTSYAFGVIVGALVAAVLAFFIAIPTLRLRADYFAIATLGLGEITMRVFVKNLQGVTGGVYGFGGIARPFEFGSDVYKTELSYLGIVAVVLVIIFLGVERMSRSPWGRALRAVREDEDAAQAFGKDTFFLKLQAFVLGAALMGASGALFAYWLRGVYPPETLFTPTDTFAVWVMVIIGGIGSNRGVLVGAWVFLFLEYVTVRLPAWFDIPPAFAIKIFYLRLIAVGVALILIILFRPQGLLPERKHVAKRPRWVFNW
jgi:branched-chain amino acid transport system permease protein